MTMVTRQNLLAEKTRFVISVGGIALAVFLMSFLMSLYQGWRLSIGRFVEHVDANIWVTREGTSDFLNAASLLPADIEPQLAAIPGVAVVDAVIVRPMQVNIGGERYSMHLVGYDVDGGSGGPPKMEQGKDPPGEGEIIVDSAFKDKAGLDIGDEIDVTGQRLTVVGVSSGGNLAFSQTTFVSLETAQTVLTMPRLSTFYLLRTADSADPQAVAGEVERQLPGVDAFTNEEFAKATRDSIMRNIVPILIVILGLAFVVGVAITGLTIYNATVEKQREFGILKAIGFTNGYLFRLVLEQSLATGALGFAVGALTTFIATRFVSDYVPEFVTLLQWRDVLLVLGATLVMSACAALLPVRRIANVDPVTVFNG